MDFHHNQSPTPSSTSSTSTPITITTTNTNSNSSSWWEQISKARSSIQTLTTLLPSSAASPLSNLADTDNPALSLLNSFPTYTSFSETLSSDSSGNSSDPLCHFLYDTYLSSNHPGLRLVVLSYLPVLIHNYLTRTYRNCCVSDSSVVSLSGYEAVLLALYSVETKVRNGRAVLVNIPDLAVPSLYHSPRKVEKGGRSGSGSGSVGVLENALEPQSAVKSTKRECIVGVALGCFYKHVSEMPSWCKLDFCRFVVSWAGKECPCVEDEDLPVEFVEEGVRELVIEGKDDERIPLGWEVLQPCLRILGHCLLGPMNGEDVKREAGVAVRRLYARASHDLVPQAILATRSLVNLDRRAKESARFGEENGTGSNVNTPSKAKKPEILLVSK